MKAYKSKQLPIDFAFSKIIIIYSKKKCATYKLFVLLIVILFPYDSN